MTEGRLVRYLPMALGFALGSFSVYGGVVSGALCIEWPLVGVGAGVLAMFVGYVLWDSKRI